MLVLLPDKPLLPDDDGSCRCHLGGADDTAAAKMKIMAECGIDVVQSPADIGATMARVLKAQSLRPKAHKAFNNIKVLLNSGGLFYLFVRIFDAFRLYALRFKLY